MGEKVRSERNRTLTLSPEEINTLHKNLIYINDKVEQAPIGIVHGNCLEVVELLPEKFVDLLFLDPPYNLTKNFNGYTFKKDSVDNYTQWLDNVISKLKRVLKENSTIYVCGDWVTSTSIYDVVKNHFYVQNRITWEREKGRGSKTNWKNCSEDIWFCTTKKDGYIFNVDDVKLRKKVIAPYKTDDGTPKDWEKSEEGCFRDTFPSNMWTDITIPFWSMPENTDHPTQKSEKLLAKLILASSNKGGFIFDPFNGSGTTCVTAKKLNRSYLGIELNEEYALLTSKRLKLAETNKDIQGYANEVFWERNAQIKK